MLEDVSRPRLAWWIFGAILAFLIGEALLTFTGALVTALFLYYVSRPVYRRLRPRFGRNFAAFGSMLALAIPVLLLVSYTFAIAIQELQALLSGVDLGPLQDVVSPYFDASSAVQNPRTLLQNADVRSLANVVLDGTLTYLPLALAVFLHLFIALAVTFYLLRDGAKFADWIRRTFGSESGIFDDYARAVDEDLSSVYFGNILNAVLAAAIAAITYYGLNAVAPSGVSIPYPALLGMLVGAASLVPVVGMKIVYPPIAVVMLTQSFIQGDPLWFPIAFFVASAVVVDFIPDILLRPYVSGRNLHVGLVMIAYVIGPVFFGWYGLFLGPLLLVLAFHFVREVLPDLLQGDRLRATPAITEASDTAEYAGVEADTLAADSAESPERQAERRDDESGTQ